MYYESKKETTPYGASGEGVRVYRAFPAHTYRIRIYTAGGSDRDQSDEY